MMKELPQKYDAKSTESRWQQHWLEAGTYHWNEEEPCEANFVIDTPPPTVSGHLHMGHVFSYTQADFVARYQRMAGKNVFYPMGFDDNGLPTERLVEKATKKRAVDFDSREAFIEACMNTSAEARKEYRALFQSTALSVDWRQEYHTISESSRRLAQESFLDLLDKGHVERRMEPMLWDPVDQTAIAQAEVEDKELPSHFCDIKFEVEESGEGFVIGTTRPELIPACVAVFYHPDDARYQHLKGKQAITPLFGVMVPILEDDAVEMEKGTGIMMCCTFGDEADIEKWRKHNLPLRMVLNKYGKIDFSTLRHSGEGRNDVLEGLKAKAAREKIIEMLAESGDLIESNPITHAVKCAERSGAPLEILPSPQWFVKVTDKKAELQAKADACNWHPEWMAKRMSQWIDGLSWDWCISRQRFFGVPFPVWYVQNQESGSANHEVIIAKPEELPINPLATAPIGYQLQEVKDGLLHCEKDGKPVILRPDTDVMDTWFTSSLSPILAASAANDAMPITQPDPRLYPADLRPQAHEIIRTWAFYTLVKSHLHHDCVPWKNLMISGWCLAEDKQKMSKSKGNVVTPLALIEEHGADVVRYWASTSKLGQDTAFSKDLLKIGKKLVNKLWNATKFAAIQMSDDTRQEAFPCEREGGQQIGHSHEQAKRRTTEAPVGATGCNQIIDKWIMSRLHRTVAKATQAFEAYEYAAVMRAVEDFFWNDFCDNYLELVKKRAYDEADENPAGKASASYTLGVCLDAILRLFAPVMPHITEELWSHIFADDYAKKGSLHARGCWPLAADYAVNDEAEAEGVAVVEILEAIRKAKSEAGVSIKWPVDELVVAQPLSPSAREDLAAAGNIRVIRMDSAQQTPLIQLAAESDAA